MYPPDQIQELKQLCEVISACSEGGVNYIFMQKLALPPQCAPDKSDALLCPTGRDGYPSRLLFSQVIQGPFARNWNFNGRICERNWAGFSWKVENPQAMRLAQLVRVHLDGFRRA